MIPAIRVMVEKDATEPTKATPGSAGWDLHALISGVIMPGARMIVPTGIKMAIPSGHVGLVCPRSGAAFKHGVTVLNAPGIIDSDYRGDIGVILINLGGGVFQFTAGDRIAQLVIMDGAYMGGLVRVSSLDETSRGEGGFGSTGV